MFHKVDLDFLPMFTCLYNVAPRGVILLENVLVFQDQPQPWDEFSPVESGADKGFEVCVGAAFVRSVGGQNMPDHCQQ